ncbi:hypothetical protein K2173_026828 [Erythroxylum novogranatense]|uniref:COMM domain-containing protein n=1 Tax=Erythroxylum novogranatense TaxID=1862640 RepID=A0AAV8TXC3_9ROSI|nr:hypothetical protein K2173_026828 [Erythroxylum novogranatense]
MEEAESEALYQHLHKLSGVKEEESLDHLLTTLWKTRRTGLRSPDKSHFQSLLNVPELDPVLACLRLLIRKCVHENFTADDLWKLFPPDLSLDLQRVLVLLLQKYQNQWKEELIREKPFPRTSVSYQLRSSVPPSSTSAPSSSTITSLWSRQDDPNHRFQNSGIAISADTSASKFVPLFIQHEVEPPDSLPSIPRLKSMTWTIENPKYASANKVAIINLKLQDYIKSPSGEMEVKFQLNRDTLEAMLRSMTYINEQLSSMVGNCSDPAPKRQRQ